MLTVLSANGPSGYRIANSLRCRSSASAYLNRTPSVAGNQQKWTWSGWVKRGTINASANMQLFAASGSTYDNAIQYTGGGTNDVLRVQFDGNNAGYVPTSGVFRDPSAWYHIVVAVDTTQAVASNRVRMYVNGIEVVYGSASYPTQNYSTLFNSTNAHNIGRSPTGANQYFDGYMADVNFIDGQALTPSSFGEIDSTTGVWKPKQYAGTYGTNGFRLNFSNGTSTTTLGYDSSGNSSNWTTNNISLTAGSTYDWMIDSPTPYQGSSYGVGNYCVLNPLTNTASLTLSSANLNVSVGNGSSWKSVTGTMAVPTSGQWYWEATVLASGGSGYEFVGIASSADSIASSYTGSTANSYGYINGGSKYNNATSASYGATWTTNDVIGIAVDRTAGSLTFYKNNVSQGTAYSGLSSSLLYVASVSELSASSNIAINFGQRPFAYTPPSGYKSLCTFNLPGPTINNGASYMAATTYTGTGATQTLSNAVNGVSFQPDFVWVKSRSSASWANFLQDTNRGITEYLISNSTGAAGTTTPNIVNAVTSTGFQILNNGNSNNPGDTYVGWQWKAGGTAVTNTAGSITSSVSANTTAGFAVVTYTGTGSNATVGHGLGVAPSMVIVKNRSVTTNWGVYHISLGASDTQYMLLNTTGAINQAGALALWNNTAPTSSLLSLGTQQTTNANANTFVAYCFAAISGYSAFGSYTGNGSTDGPFVYCGFRPRFVMVKRTDSSGAWVMYDSNRLGYNEDRTYMQANSSSAEVTDSGAAGSWSIDLISNGFKLRASSEPTVNPSGGTMIYAAFAENPFKYSLAR